MFKKPKNKDKALKAKARAAIRRKQQQAQARSDSNSDSDGEGDGDNHAAHNDVSVKKEEEEGNGDAPKGKEEEKEEKSSTTFDRILQTKKRRKLKNALLRQQGGGVVGVVVGAAAAKKRRIAHDHHPLQDEREGDDGAGNLVDAHGGGSRNDDLRQRLRGTFGGGDGSSSAVDGEGGGGEGVLGQKHRAAMEKYIQERMMDSNAGNDTVDQGQDKDQVNADADRQLLLDEDALYRQVAAEVGVAGNVQDQAAMAAAAPGETSTTADEKTTSKEDDVGAGGMMLAGTGIAEVALPVDERIRTVRETELLASSAAVGAGAGTGRGRGRGRGSTRRVGASMVHPASTARSAEYAAGEGQPMSAQEWKAMLPTSFGGGKKHNKKQQQQQQQTGAGVTQEIASTGMAVPQMAAAAMATAPSTATAGAPAPGRKPPVASSAGAAVLPTDVADLSQSYSHNFKLHTHQWVADRKTEQQREIDRVRREQEEREGTVENRARVGFEQARRVARGAGGEVVAAAGGGMVGGTGSGSGGGGGSGGSGSHATTGGMAGGGTGDRNRSSDDRVWRSFVSKQRNRR